MLRWQAPWPLPSSSLRRTQGRKLLIWRPRSPEGCAGDEAALVGPRQEAATLDPKGLAAFPCYVLSSFPRACLHCLSPDLSGGPSRGPNQREAGRQERYLAHWTTFTSRDAQVGWQVLYIRLNSRLKETGNQKRRHPWIRWLLQTVAL